MILVKENTARRKRETKQEIDQIIQASIQAFSDHWRTKTKGEVSVELSQFIDVNGQATRITNEKKPVKSALHGVFALFAPANDEVAELRDCMLAEIYSRNNGYPVIVYFEGYEVICSDAEGLSSALKMLTGSKSSTRKLNEFQDASNRHIDLGHHRRLI